MSKYGKLYPVSFGFAFGLISGIGWLLLCWAGARWGWGLPLIALIHTMFYNVAPTFLGGLWGFLHGFIHSFIFGIFVALVYNCSSKLFCPKAECESCK